MHLFSTDLGVDFGTSQIRIYVPGKGVVLREPSVVALDKNTGKILEMGAAARNMLGRTPGNVVAVHPMQRGILSDYEMTVRMLHALFRKAMPSRGLAPKPRVVLSVPSGITEIEERIMIHAAMEAGARRVYLVESVLAAAWGARLDIRAPQGHMIVDIGGGTTDIAVLTMGGVATSASIPIAGNRFDDAIARYVRRRYGVVIGETTAEEIKIQIGRVYERPGETSITVQGRDATSGMPKELMLRSSELVESLWRLARQITDEVLAVLERTSPELVSDLTQTGITLTGGGSLLWGMDLLLMERTGLTCTVAEDPDACVIYGCGKSLAWLRRMHDGPINLARKRAMRGG